MGRSGIGRLLLLCFGLMIAAAAHPAIAQPSSEASSTLRSREVPAKRVAKVKIGRRKTQGFCNKADIKSVLVARVEALKACYEAGLDEHPALGGKLVASWVIRMEGDTRTLRVPTNALGEGPTTQCITRVLSRMRFKPPKGGVCLVEQSFTFSARP